MTLTTRQREALEEILAVARRHVAEDNSLTPSLRASWERDFKMVRDLLDSSRREAAL